MVLSAESSSSIQTCCHSQKQSVFHRFSASSPPAPSAPAPAVACPALALVCPPAPPRARRYDLRKGERERGDGEIQRGRGTRWRMGGEGEREREHSAVSFEQYMTTFRHTLFRSLFRSLPSSLPPSVPHSLPLPLPPISLSRALARTHTRTHTDLERTRISRYNARTLPHPRMTGLLAFRWNTQRQRLMSH